MTTQQRVFIDLDGVIVDFDAYMKTHNLTAQETKTKPSAYFDMEPIDGALQAVRALIESGHDVWIASKPPTGVPRAYADKVAWVMKYLPELTRKIILTHDKGLLGGVGDILIDDRPHKANCCNFKGTFIFFQGDWNATLLEVLEEG